MLIETGTVKSYLLKFQIMKDFLVIGLEVFMLHSVKTLSAFWLY